MTDDQQLEEVIHARGHEHVSARHSSTFEVTTDDYLTPAGDCILAIDADRSPADFDPAFVAACQDEAATITITLEADGHTQTITGRGDPDLELTSERSMVGRTSTYIDERTILLEASQAARDVDRELVAALAAGKAVTVTLSVQPADHR